MAELKQLPDVVDLSFVAGDTFRIRIRVIEPVEGTLEPLAGYSFAAEIGKDPSREVVAEFETAPDPDDPDHSIILTLPSSATEGLPALGDGVDFKGLWDLEVSFPNGDVRTVAKGAVLCQIDITNRPPP